VYSNGAATNVTKRLPSRIARLKDMENKEIWIFVFCMGTLFFNWPILGTVKASLPYYLYGAWACFIGVIAFIIFLERRRRG
jgi:putative Ca2+/H+ antiporter (TMEM165/GDT1 family)